MSYCPFKIGQHVVCIDTANYLIGEKVGAPEQLREGRVYTISALNAFGSIVAVQVAELPWLVDIDGWYGHWRFKPLQKLKVEDFMTSDAPVDGVKDLVA